MFNKNSKVSNTLRRYLAVALALVMLIGVVPSNVFVAGDTYQISAQQENGGGTHLR